MYTVVYPGVVGWHSREEVYTHHGREGGIQGGIYQVIHPRRYTLGYTPLLYTL